MIQTQVKGVAAHMKQARAWTSVEVTERLAAQPPPPPCVSRVPLREMRRGGRGLTKDRYVAGKERVSSRIFTHESRSRVTVRRHAIHMDPPCRSARRRISELRGPRSTLHQPRTTVK